MYILYYISESLQVSTIEVDSLDKPLLIPENLHFIALRKGINFIDEPHKCIDFTHIERLAMSKRLDDLNIFKEHPFRLKNSYLNPLCPIDGQNLPLKMMPLEIISEIHNQADPKPFYYPAFKITDNVNHVLLDGGFVDQLRNTSKNYEFPFDADLNLSGTLEHYVLFTIIEPIEVYVSFLIGGVWVDRPKQILSYWGTASSPSAVRTLFLGTLVPGTEKIRLRVAYLPT